MASGIVPTALSVVSDILSTAATVTRIDILPALVAHVPLTVLLVGHCLAIAGLTRGRYTGALLSFVQGYLMAFGGGIASNIFLMRPQSTPIFASNEFFVIWAICWWVLNYNPLDIIKQATDLAPVGITARVCLQTLRATLVASQVTAAVKSFPGIVAVAIIAGTLSGSGGKVLTDAVSVLTGARVSSELAHPTYALRSSLAGAVIYYVTVHALGALTAAQGHGLLLLAFIGHSLADDLLDSTFDWTVPVVDAFSVAALMKPLPRWSRARAVEAAPAETPRSASRKRRSKRSE